MLKPGGDSDDSLYELDSDLKILRAHISRKEHTYPHGTPYSNTVLPQLKQNLEHDIKNLEPNILARKKGTGLDYFVEVIKMPSTYIVIERSSHIRRINQGFKHLTP